MTRGPLAVVVEEVNRIKCSKEKDLRRRSVQEAKGWKKDLRPMVICGVVAANERPVTWEGIHYQKKVACGQRRHVNMEGEWQKISDAGQHYQKTKGVRFAHPNKPKHEKLHCQKSHKGKGEGQCDLKNNHGPAIILTYLTGAEGKIASGPYRPLQSLQGEMGGEEELSVRRHYHQGSLIVKKIFILDLYESA